MRWSRTKPGKIDRDRKQIVNFIMALVAVKFPDFYLFVKLQHDLKEVLIFLNVYSPPSVDSVVTISNEHVEFKFAWISDRRVDSLCLVIDMRSESTMPYFFRVQHSIEDDILCWDLEEQCNLYDELHKFMTGDYLRMYYDC